MNEATNHPEGAPRLGWRETLTRAATLVAIAVLWLSVLATAVPATQSVPVLGPLVVGAAGALRALTLVPGIPVFTDPTGGKRQWITSALCPSFNGHRADGTVVSLYAPDCPPVGFQWAHDAFDEMIQYTTRHIRPRLLLDTHDEPPEEFPEALRRYVALGDFFCHSPLVAPDDLSALSMRWTMHSRHFETGRFGEQSLVCRWLCNQPGQYRPVCEMTKLIQRGPSAP